jgi:hypothetical protein
MNIHSIIISRGQFNPITEMGANPMKWLEKRRQHEDLEELTKAERQIFREMTDLDIRVKEQKTRIFNEYMKKGQMPPKTLIFAFKETKIDLEIARELHIEIEDARSKLKRRAKSGQSGITGNLELTERQKKILADIRESDIQTMRGKIHAATVDAKEKIRTGSYLKALEDARIARAGVFDEVTSEITTDFERDFLSDMMSSYPEDWEQVPDKLKQIADDKDKEARDVMGNY